MTNNCYVKVNNKTKDESYDVGPFIESGNEKFSDSESAINWIYKQIGLIKVINPDAILIKHKWNYLKDDFMGPSADIKVEIAEFTFEIFSLKDPRNHDVISEEFEENNIPPGFN